MSRVTTLASCLSASFNILQELSLASIVSRTCVPEFALLCALQASCVSVAKYSLPMCVCLSLSLSLSLSLFLSHSLSLALSLSLSVGILAAGVQAR